VIRSCVTETVEGVTFEWVDVDGDPENGCECRRRQGNLTVDDPDVKTAFPDVGTPFFDENCDGVDGVQSDAVFVSASAPAGGDGSLGRPFTTIAQGLDAVRARSDRLYVLVAEGRYEEQVELERGDRLYGGYSGDFASRDVVQLPSVIRASASGDAPNQASVVVRAPGFAQLAGFTVRGPDLAAAAAGEAGRNSVAVWIAEGSAQTSIRNNAIIAGRAEDGGRGTAGSTGFGRDDSFALDGEDGLDHERIFGPCSSTFSRPGGTGGSNARCATGGRAGGGVVCPVFDWTADPVRGDQAEFVTPVGGDGEGGFDWSFDDISGPGCTHATESGFPSDIDPHSGADGADGSDGANGVDGAGCRAPFGRPPAGGFSPAAGEAGRDVHGGGGGGGGAGGGTARFLAGGCREHEVGATGGGGGAGGCAGAGGAAGAGGGASIAVLITDASGAPAVSDNRVTRGPGGAGGDGGLGGAGGRGGVGGFGGNPTEFSGSNGGRGGDGGNGGTGGTGGGGCGGASFGVLAIGAPAPAGTNDVTNPTADLGGPGGEGGLADGTDDDGLDGPSENDFRFASCPGGSCPVGQSCVGGFCFPN
jgi:hypothetical protein